MTAVRWSHGDTAIGRAVAAALAAGEGVTLRDSAHRAVIRLQSGSLDVAVKCFRSEAGARGLRERAKAALGRSPARREWCAATAMQSAGIAVPRPLALGTAPDGSRWLVSAWIEGTPFAAALAAPFASRTQLVVALANALRSVHAAGFVHADLHAGNVIVRDGGPVLLDWQHARRSVAASARARDLARLEFALSRLVSRGQRMRVRRIVLGAGATEAALRAAGRAAHRRAQEHARTRTRNACRPGTLAARAAAGGARGLVLRDLAALDLVALLTAHDAALCSVGTSVLGDSARSRVTAHTLDARRVVVKETPFRGTLRALADLVRGSAGIRAWRGGHGLRIRNIGAATPLALLERRVLGVPVQSWIVLEDLRPAPMAAFALDVPTEEVLDALGHLVIRLHRAGSDHGDLKGTHVFLTRDADRLVPKLIDLEGVRFRRRISETRRRRALVELNASLPDAFPAALRCRVFARYAAALPFAAGSAAARAAIVRESVARAHRWSGAGCADAAST